MNIEVVRLNKNNQDKLLDLFVDCFCEDSYYQKLFPNKNSALFTIKRIFIARR